MSLRHEQFIDHLEEYVLGTMEPELSQALEDHLDSGCEACRIRLVELSETAARMASMGLQVQPSPELKGKIMESISSRLPAAAEPKTSESFGKVTVVFALVSSAAAIVLAVWAWDASQDNKALRNDLKQHSARIDQMQQELEAYKDATALLTAPGMQFFDLAGVAPNEQAFGKVVIEPDGGTAVVYMYELPPTPEGMDYQLWMMRDNVPTSVGTFTVSGDGSASLTLDQIPDMGTFASFDVTIEPAGGAPQPTGMMYLTSPQVIQLPDSE